MATITILSSHNGLVRVDLTYHDSTLRVTEIAVVNTGDAAAVLVATRDDGSWQREITINPGDNLSYSIPGSSGARFVEVVDAETGPELQSNYSVSFRSG